MCSLHRITLSQLHKTLPYYDETPLAVAHTPEVREYMAIGVVNDEEIGEMSEIKEVVYAG